MGQVLEDGFDFDAQHGNRVYPWEEWADGQAREIAQGVDFDVEPEVMRGQIIVRARKIGKRVRTNIGWSGDTGLVRFQFLDPEPEPAPAR